MLELCIIPQIDPWDILKRANYSYSEIFNFFVKGLTLIIQQLFEFRVHSSVHPNVENTKVTILENLYFFSEIKIQQYFAIECTLNSKSCRIILFMGPKLDLDEIINP